MLSICIFFSHVSVCYFLVIFFSNINPLHSYENIFYKNIEAEICEILRIF